MLMRPIFAATLLLMASPAFAFECPNLMAEVDSALAEANLTDEQRTQIEALRAEGEELHAAGEHAASVAKLNEAKALLGL